MTRPLLVGVCTYNITQIQVKKGPAELHVQGHTGRNLFSPHVLSWRNVDQGSKD